MQSLFEVVTILFIMSTACSKPKADREIGGALQQAGVAEHSRRKATQWNAMRCGERDLPGKEQDFEKFSEDGLKSAAFPCAMVRYLDRDDLGDREKFLHLAEQGKRSGRWGAAMFGWMADLSWEQFEEYIVSRAKDLRSEEVIAICGPYGWDYLLKDRSSSATARLKSALFERAMKERDEEVRGYAMGFVSNHSPSLEEALALAKKLPQESNSGSRQVILDSQTWHDHPATNRIVRDALKGPLEASIVEWLCEYELVKHHRYDFLPDLYSLRKRLANEKDLRWKEESHRALESVDKGIKALEELKRKKAPIAGAKPAEPAPESPR
jgi:hypothetical protein